MLSENSATAYAVMNTIIICHIYIYDDFIECKKEITHNCQTFQSQCNKALRN